jgi:type IV secretion system protein VirD4
MKQKKLPLKTASLDALDLIDKRSRTAIDLAKGVANAIVVTTGQEKDPHWNISAEEGIAGLIATTAWYGQPGQRSLQDVDRLATDPKQLAMAIALMQKPDPITGHYPWDGMLARMGGRMEGWSGEERSGIISTMGKNLSFLRTPAISAVTRTSSFKPQFKRKKQTAYIVCPPEFIRPMSGWTRVMVWAFFTSVVREGLGEDRLVHAVLDETASLEANFGALEDALDKYRGYGLRNHLFYQSYGQLIQKWPKDQGTTLLSNTSKIFMGISDMQTASLVSSMLGKTTIAVESTGHNTSGGSNQSYSQGSHGSSSSGTNRGWGTSTNWQQAPRELAKPEELLTLDPRIAITFPGFGIPPVATRTVRFFEEPALFTRRSGGIISRFRAACRTLVGATILLAGAIGLAAALTDAVTARNRLASSAAMYPGAGPGPAGFPVQSRPNYRGF